MRNVKEVWIGIVGIGVLSSLVLADAPAGDVGKKMYDSKCASCHGKNGKGNASMAKVFKVTPADLDIADDATNNKKDDELLKIIAGGKNKMPAFSKQLKAEELKLIVQYIRSFTPKKVEVKPAESSPQKSEQKPAVEKATEKPAESAPAKSEVKPATEKVLDAAPTKSEEKPTAEKAPAEATGEIKK